MNEIDNFKEFKSTYNSIVKQLVENRNASKSTQDMVAKWIEVDRRKIIDFENLTRFDVELMCKYCDIFGIDLDFRFRVN